MVLVPGNETSGTIPGDRPRRDAPCQVSPAVCGGAWRSSGDRCARATRRLASRRAHRRTCQRARGGRGTPTRGPVVPSPAGDPPSRPDRRLDAAGPHRPVDGGRRPGPVHPGRVRLGAPGRSGDLRERVPGPHRQPDRGCPARPLWAGPSDRPRLRCGLCGPHARRPAVGGGCAPGGTARRDRGGELAHRHPQPHRPAEPVPDHRAAPPVGTHQRGGLERLRGGDPAGAADRGRPRRPPRAAGRPGPDRRSVPARCHRADRDRRPDPAGWVPRSTPHRRMGRGPLHLGQPDPSRARGVDLGRQPRRRDGLDRHPARGAPGTRSERGAGGDRLRDLGAVGHGLGLHLRSHGHPGPRVADARGVPGPAGPGRRAPPPGERGLRPGRPAGGSGPRDRVPGVLRLPGRPARHRPVHGPPAADGSGDAGTRLRRLDGVQLPRVPHRGSADRCPRGVVAPGRHRAGGDRMPGRGEAGRLA